ncbi:MAG: Na+/H+ antiporter subunit E [Candidatus Cloacimonadaceae bacterium]|nr:Na+/H+ antiporter subunit E [Candidatus Cloacimonadaceae bacterium]MDP3113430.1 Na+/H+ antiporter subunit E [Candidatus Cloacimonadaceae bacterium]
MKYITLFISMFFLWMLLTFNLGVYNIIIGLASAFIVTLLFGNRFLRDWRKFYNPLRYIWALVYLIVLIWECIRANFDVAYRVLSPRMPIKPGIVKIRSSLKTDIAKTFLANSITMTPGTITVDVIDDDFYVHWIYVSSQDPAVYTRKIIGRFEKILKEVFE